jgi:hypothetical protein
MMRVARVTAHGDCCMRQVQRKANPATLISAKLICRYLNSE